MTRVTMNNAVAMIAELSVQTEMCVRLARKLAFAFEDFSVEVNDHYIFGSQRPQIFLPTVARRNAHFVLNTHADVAAAGVGQLAREQQCTDAGDVGACMSNCVGHGIS